MDNHDKSIAGSQEYESPGFDPTPQGLPTAALRDAWAAQLRDIEQASSWEVLAGHFYHSAGWLEALVQVRVIDPAASDALRAERNAAQKLAAERLAGGAQ